MAAAATLSFGIISTLCSLFGADEAPYEQIEYPTPTAVHGQLAAIMNKPGEVDVLPEVRSLEPGEVRFVSITNIGDLPCCLEEGSMPEIGSRIGTTALEGILEAADANDDEANRSGRLATSAG